MSMGGWNPGNADRITGGFSELGQGLMGAGQQMAQNYAQNRPLSEYDKYEAAVQQGLIDASLAALGVRQGIPLDKLVQSQGMGAPPQPQAQPQQPQAPQIPPQMGQASSTAVQAAGMARPPAPPPQAPAPAPVTGAAPGGLMRQPLQAPAPQPMPQQAPQAPQGLMAAAPMPQTRQDLESQRNLSTRLSTQATQRQRQESNETVAKTHAEARTKSAETNAVAKVQAAQDRARAMVNVMTLRTKADIYMNAEKLKVMSKSSDNQYEYWMGLLELGEKRVSLAESAGERQQYSALLKLYKDELDAFTKMQTSENVQFADPGTLQSIEKAKARLGVLGNQIVYYNPDAKPEAAAPTAKKTTTKKGTTTTKGKLAPTTSDIDADLESKFGLN
jgi:hypothetical protein